MIITTQKLVAISPRLNGQGVTIAKLAAWGIDTPRRLAHFLAQCSAESGGFAKTVENLNYRSAEAICRMFRSGFDLDKDKVIDPEELEFARGFIGSPERIANRAYANRNGNGDEASGDGWHFRGRAWIQVTGRDNYRACSQALFKDDRLLRNPELLEAQPDCALASAWFWRANKLNHWADKDDVDAVSGVINRGGPKLIAHNLDGRRSETKRIKTILED